MSVITDIRELVSKFHKTSGHMHTGAEGDAPIIPVGGALIAIYEDTTDEGDANTLKFTTNLGVSFASGVATISVDSAPTFTNITDSGLTITRVPYASTGGLLIDSAAFTFDGTTVKVPQLTDSGLTITRVPYASTAGLLVDSADMVFDGTGLNVHGLTVHSFTTAGILHNAVTTGIISSSLIVNADVSATADIVVTKLYSSATSRVFGRITALAGAGEELTGANVRTICGLATTDDVTFDDVTATSFIIGANTLTTSEWAYLDGLDQAVKTTSSVVHAELTLKTGANTFLTIDDNGTGYGAIGAKLDLYAAGSITWGGGQTIVSDAGGGLSFNCSITAGLIGTHMYQAAATNPFIYSYLNTDSGTTNRFEVLTDGTISWKAGDGAGVNCTIQRVYSAPNTFLSILADDILWLRGTQVFVDAPLRIGSGNGILKVTTGVVSAVSLAPADITFAATARVLGRITAGGGAGEELTGANIATILGSPTFTGLTVNGATVLNEGGADVDTRIEGDTDVNLVNVDAGLDKVCFGGTTPTEKVDVRGNITVNNNELKYVRIHNMAGAAPTWTGTTLMGSLPSADGWTFDGTDEGRDCSVAGGILTIDTIGHGTATARYYKSVTLNNALGYTIEAKVKVDSAEGANLFQNDIFVRDGAYYYELNIYSDRITTKDTVASIDYVMDTTTDYHIYRIVTKGTVVKVYVDGILRITAAIATASGDNYLEFGDDSATNNVNSKSYWDYIKWSDDGDYEPLPEVAGATYYDTTVNKLKFFNGTAWETVTST